MHLLAPLINLHKYAHCHTSQIQFNQKAHSSMVFSKHTTSHIKNGQHEHFDSTIEHMFCWLVIPKSGFFTNELIDELLFDLNNSLYQLLSDSFIPSFNGHGLRFGKIWSSPENEESADWLKQKLNEINEKVVDHWSFWSASEQNLLERSFDFKWNFEQFWYSEKTSLSKP